MKEVAGTAGEGPAISDAQGKSVLILGGTHEAVLETLCRYLTFRLRHEDIRFNALCYRIVRTETFAATFGAELVPLARRLGYESCFVEAEEVGRAAPGPV
jgi:hypothetical protein